MNRVLVIPGPVKYLIRLLDSSTQERALLEISSPRSPDARVTGLTAF